MSVVNSISEHRQILKFDADFRAGISHLKHFRSDKSFLSIHSFGNYICLKNRQRFFQDYLSDLFV